MTNPTYWIFSEAGGIAATMGAAMGGAFGPLTWFDPHFILQKGAKSGGASPPSEA